MLTTKPTAKMIKEWLRVYSDYREQLFANNKTGEEVNAYFFAKYKPDTFTQAEFKKVVLYNIMENAHNKEKLPLGVSPNIATYKAGKILVGIDLVTGFFHAEGEDIAAVAEIYDDLFMYRGLDEKDLDNYFLVAQYVQLKQRDSMTVRRSKIEDIKSIMPIYDYAREQMANSGNPTQWIDGYPSQDIILNDIANDSSYIIESKGKIVGVFTFIIGIDPTYQKIDGKWLDDAPYGTIHRLASDGTEKGIFIECLNFCKSKISNIRLDTHNDNKIMRHLLDKTGFTQCGFIIGRDGAQRIAYQKKF